MTFEAHQKLATLSSKRPLWKGNIRVIGSDIPDNGEKGGRNGRNATIKDRIVVAARRRNKLNLPSSQ